MCLFACTGTVHAAFDIGLITSTCSTYNHLRIIFHAANLATTIDITIHRGSTADADIRCIRNGFLTPECVGNTLARSEYIAFI